jgi:hypothetical protein
VLVWHVDRLAQVNQLCQLPGGPECRKSTHA